MKSFFNAQFNYCPLILMLHSRETNKKIKHLHERCLRLIYSEKKSSYENLLEKDNSVSIHHKKFQALAISYAQKLLVIIFMESTKISTICVTVLIL